MNQLQMLEVQFKAHGKLAPHGEKCATPSKFLSPRPPTTFEPPPCGLMGLRYHVSEDALSRTFGMNVEFFVTSATLRRLLVRQ